MEMKDNDKMKQIKDMLSRGEPPMDADASGREKVEIEPVHAGEEASGRETVESEAGKDSNETAPAGENTVDGKTEREKKKGKFSVKSVFSLKKKEKEGEKGEKKGSFSLSGLKKLKKPSFGLNFSSLGKKKGEKKTKEGKGTFAKSLKLNLPGLKKPGKVKERFAALDPKKKAIVIVVAAFVALYLVYEGLKPSPKYTPLPPLTITGRNRPPVTRPHGVPPRAGTSATSRTERRASGRLARRAGNPGRKPSESEGKTAARKPVGGKIPIPVLRTPTGNTTMSKFVKQNTSAIVKATKEQEKELFDIFRMEPQDEYKIDRLISLAKKQNEFLAVEVAILQKKQKIEKILKQLQIKTGKEKELQQKLAALTGEINDLKQKLEKVQKKAQQRPSESEQYNPKFGLPKKNPFPITLPSAPITTPSKYLNELKGVTVGIIYTYKGNEKIAVINNNGRLYRVKKGDMVTDHFKVLKITSDGVIVGISNASKGVFIPLSLGVSASSGGRLFGVVDRKTAAPQGQRGGGNPFVNAPLTNTSSPAPPPPPITPPFNHKGGF